jgi:hypothetical protein
MRQHSYSRFFSITFAGAALAGIFAFGGVQQARAEGCQERVARADHNLHEAIEHRGYDSRQAEHARHQLREARESCWNSDHRWWDPDGNRWHTDRDWDDNDHRDYHGDNH